VVRIAVDDLLLSSIHPQAEGKTKSSKNHLKEFVSQEKWWEKFKKSG